MRKQEAMQRKKPEKKNTFRIEMKQRFSGVRVLN